MVGIEAAIERIHKFIDEMCEQEWVYMVIIDPQITFPDDYQFIKWDKKIEIVRELSKGWGKPDFSTTSNGVHLFKLFKNG